MLESSLLSNDVPQGLSELVISSTHIQSRVEDANDSQHLSSIEIAIRLSSGLVRIV